MRVNTAADAIEMPVMAANTALACTVASPSPPRTRPNMRCAASKASLPMPAAETSMPISTKSGTTAKSWLSSVLDAAVPSRPSARSTSPRRIHTPAKDTTPSATAMLSPA